MATINIIKREVVGKKRNGRVNEPTSFLASSSSTGGTIIDWAEVTPDLVTIKRDLHVTGNITATKEVIAYVASAVTSDVLDALTATKPLEKTGTDIKLKYNANQLEVNSSNELQIKPSVLTPAEHTHSISDVANLQTTLDSKLNTNLKGSVNGLAELDASGFVKNTQLPSYVDDVIDGQLINSTRFDALPTPHNAGGTVVPEGGKIYLDIVSNLTYRWSGTIFTATNSSLALGETSETAYRGDRGKIAYEHSQLTHDKYLIGLGNVDNTSDASKSVNYANSAGYSSKINLNTNNTISDLNIVSSEQGVLRFDTYNMSASNQPAVQDNANGVITMLTNHGSEYGKQIAFADNDDLYIRKLTAGNYGNWLNLIHSGNINSQSVNYSNTAGSISGYNNPVAAPIGNTTVYRDSDAGINAKRLNSYATDTDIIFNSFNSSAGNLSQFKIIHNYADTIITKDRGNLYFQGSADYATTAYNSDLIDGIDSSQLFVKTRSNISSADLNTFSNLDSGTYPVIYAGYSSQLTVFSNKFGGSASGVEILSEYGNEHKIRTSIDSNRYTDFQTIYTSLNLNKTTIPFAASQLSLAGWIIASDGSNLLFKNASGVNELKLDQNGNLTASGEVTAYSDIRLKSNIKQLTVRGDLNPVTMIVHLK